MAAPLMATAPPAALLLTGGGSRRMGHDKADLVVGGGRLGERTANLLRQVAEPVMEVGPGYTSLPRTLEDPPRSGPLAALAAGAAALHQRGHRGPVLVVATDLPRLTAGYLQILAAHEAPSADHSVVPRDTGGRAQPLCARYSPLALARAGELAGAGHRSMMALLEQVPIAWLDVTDSVAPGSTGAEPGGPNSPLFDVDTPEDLAALNLPSHW